MEVHVALSEGFSKNHSNCKYAGTPQVRVAPGNGKTPVDEYYEALFNSSSSGLRIIQ